jgi:hypothetical protein
MVYKNKFCSRCKKEFTPLSPTSKYCSKDCAYKEKRKRLLLDKKLNLIKYIKRNLRYKENSRDRLEAKGNIVLCRQRYKCTECGEEYIPKYVNQKTCQNKECVTSRDTKLSRLKRCRNRERIRKLDHIRYWKDRNINPYEKRVCVICKSYYINKHTDINWCSDNCYKEYIN